MPLSALSGLGQLNAARHAAAINAAQSAYSQNLAAMQNAYPRTPPYKAREESRFHMSERCATCAHCRPDPYFQIGGAWVDPPRIGFGEPLRIRRPVEGSALEYAKCRRSASGSYCSIEALECRAGGWYEAAPMTAPVEAPVFDLTDWILPALLTLGLGVLAVFAFVLGSFDPMQWGWKWRGLAVLAWLAALPLAWAMRPKRAYFYFRGGRDD